MISQEKLGMDGAAVNNIASRNDERVLLTANQLVKAAALGVVFWLTAALAVRYGSQAGFFGNFASVLMFAVSVPIGWLSVQFIKRAAALRSAQMISGIAVGTAVAAFCDGIAMTWTSLYGSEAERVLPGAAWILWGVGIFLSFAYLDAVRGKTK